MRNANLMRLRKLSMAQIQDFGGLHYAADNCVVPAGIKPGDDVTDLNFSPALRHLKRALKKECRIIFLGEMGGGAEQKLNLNTYVFVRQKRKVAAFHCEDPHGKDI